MGAMTTTTNPSKTNLQQVFLDANYFDSLKYQLKFFPYAQQRTVPGGAGHTSVNFFRPRKASLAGVNTMGIDYNEGVVPTNATEVNVGYVTAYLDQRIAFSKISDLERATGLIDAQKLHAKKIGEDMGLLYDTVCCNSMFANPAIVANLVNASQSTLYNSNGSYERFAIANPTGNSANDFATLVGGSASAGAMSRNFAIGCMTQLEENDVPMINNRYPAICAPRVLNDMRKDSTWVTAAAYNAKELSLFDGGEFDLDGAVYIRSTRGWREGATYGTRSDTGNVFGVAFLGKDAFGVPTLSNGKAGGSGNAPIMQYIDTPDSSNPALQFVMLSAKTYFGAVLIKTNETTDVPHVVLGRVLSTFA